MGVEEGPRALERATFRARGPSLALLLVPHLDARVGSQTRLPQVALRAEMSSVSAGSSGRVLPHGVIGTGATDSGFSEGSSSKCASFACPP